VTVPSTTELEAIGARAGRPLAVCVDHALSDSERAALLSAAVSERRYFVEASTGGADEHRRALVHYTTVDEADPVVALAKTVALDAAKVLGVDLGAVARVERQLTVHLDGCFYRAHRDNQGEEASRRALAYVYYFHGPRRWSGGELVLAGDEPLVVVPADNRMVMFDASVLHEVRPVEAPSPLAFHEGRFTVNGWVWR
jgi:Rps23 Pro-64 3,4-dihydroxylase Tpa1-like proline 4-hydroxylase